MAIVSHMHLRPAAASLGTIADTVAQQFLASSSSAAWYSRPSRACLASKIQPRKGGREDGRGEARANGAGGINLQVFFLCLCRHSQAVECVSDGAQCRTAWPSSICPFGMGIFAFLLDIYHAGTQRQTTAQMEHNLTRLAVSISLRICLVVSITPCYDIRHARM